METLAYLQSAVAHEDLTPNLELRSLQDLGLALPSSAWVGLVGVLMTASLLLGSGMNVQASQQVTVRASTGLNIRSGPSYDSPVINKLEDGQTVEIVDSTAGWHQLAGGGWVSSGYTTSPYGSAYSSSSSSSAYSSSTATSSIRTSGGGGGSPVSGLVTVTGSPGVNIRSGPGTNYLVTGRLNQGDRVQVVASFNGFYQLSSGGWVSSAYVSRGFSSGGGGTNNSPIGTPISGTVAVTARAGVNIRSGPSTRYPVWGSLGPGARVQVVAVADGFYQLSGGGWILAAYTTTNLANANSPGSYPGGFGGGGSPTSGFVTVTAGSGLNVRSGPGINNPIVGLLGFGQRVRVIAAANDFYQLSNGTWIYSGYTSGG